MQACSPPAGTGMLPQEALLLLLLQTCLMNLNCMDNSI